MDYAAGSRADFHFLPLTLGHFLMGSAYAKLQQIDTENIKLTNVTRYKRICSILELFWERLVAELTTHLNRWVSKTRGVSSTTEAVHLNMIDCVDTSGFLLAVEFSWQTVAPTSRRAIRPCETWRGKIGPAWQWVQSHFDIVFRCAPPRAPCFRGLVKSLLGQRGRKTNSVNKHLTRNKRTGKGECHHPC
jgi:hypothetical protein